MLRKIIKIDENKCNGCALCATACHENAIAMVNGKAKLLRDDYCDGLGDCLPVCPTGAISFEEREAAAYDESAVKANMIKKQKSIHSGSCPGINQKTIERHKDESSDHCGPDPAKAQTHLNQWPVQIKLVPQNASYFHNSNLLIAADCSAYSYGNFHNEFMKNRITIIGCPKLDHDDYAEKLTEILKANDIRSVTIVRMDVPCCTGIENAAKTALKNCDKMIPWQVVTISTNGNILE